MWSSDQHQHSAPHPQYDAAEDNVYVNGDVVVNGGSKPELIYAQIQPVPRSNRQGRGKVTSPSVKENNAVIYSDLESVGAQNHTVAPPSKDVYAVVKR